MKTEILTRKEVCELLRCSRAYLDHAGKNGPPFHRIGTRSIRYIRSDVMAWLGHKKDSSNAIL